MTKRPFYLKLSPVEIQKNKRRVTSKNENKQHLFKIMALSDKT